MLQKKFQNFAKCLTYELPQAIGLPRHRRSKLGGGGGAFSVFVWGHRNVLKIESKFLMSRVLAGGFVMGCAKKVLVLSIYKKVVEKSAV